MDREQNWNSRNSNGVLLVFFLPQLPSFTVIPKKMFVIMQNRSCTEKILSIQIREFILVGLLIFLSGAISFGQNSKKDFKGTFSHSAGEAGRTYKGADGSKVSIIPITYEKTTLQIKSFGRVQFTETSAFQDVTIKYNGYWTTHLDTIFIRYKRMGEPIEESFRLKPFGLESLSGKPSFHRQ